MAKLPLNLAVREMSGSSPGRREFHVLVLKTTSSIQASAVFCMVTITFLFNKVSSKILKVK